ncbi:putative ABC exporter domain-containing protein [Clostridium estertheticum]|uniref:putative ABC exporter domain-containing protein n=1 Tax=Clostridium estertheticum TaxID=238834 RepID=UPI001C0E5D59|nr:putative ABC exporter domain-containing protein [Clostridium estertheticum]MBU3215517.1 putative ABC exporter domain-containing protein [Clostridium estertheticum]WAG56257.1 putative ABC exporter domain-containing protein [Clostridium estertheticum]
MKPLFYILRKSIKNWILELKKKPVKLILYIVCLIVLCLAFFVNKDNSSEKSILDPRLYSTIIGVVILIFTAPDIYSSTNKGATFFRGADINLIFTSPTSPQKVLIYGFIKQIYASFIAVFFVLFQGYTLSHYSNIKSYGVLVIVFGLFIMLIFTSILKILVYSIASKSIKNKLMLRNIFKILGMFIIIAYFIELYVTKSPGKAIMSMLNSPAIPYIPVYGWTREIIMASMKGISTIFFIYTILIIALGAICCYIIYSMKLDYYEDVLASTELKETAISASRHGEQSYMQTGKKPRIRKVQYTKKGKFASAIFGRQILEYKKTGFGFINVGSVIYAVLAITAGLYSPVKDLAIILGGMIYLQLIFNFANKWRKDLSNQYIYMLPDHTFKKVIYVTAVDNFKNIIDGAIVFVITGILFKSSVVFILLNIVAFASIGCLFIYGGILTRRILGGGDNIVSTGFIRILILGIIIAPAIVLLAVLYSFSTSFAGVAIAYASFISYNLIFSGIILFLGKGIFENIEL